MDTTTKGIGKEKKQKYEQEHKQTAAPASAYSKFVQTVQEIRKLFQCDCGAEYTSNNHHYQNHIKILPMMWVLYGNKNAELESLSPDILATDYKMIVISGTSW